MDDDVYNQAWAMADAGERSATGVQPGPTPTGSMSGFLQQALAITGGAINRKLDIELAQKLAGSQPMPYRYTNQPMIGMGGAGVDLTTRTVSSVGGMRLGDMLPFLVGGLVLFMVLGKR